MVKRRAAAASLDRVFRALASEPRREMLRQVATVQRTVTELAESFDMSLAAVSKHVRVLEDARLVRQTRAGRLHWCRLNPQALEPARASIDEVRMFWNQQLDGLEGFLVGRSDAQPSGARTRKRGRS